MAGKSRRVLPFNSQAVAKAPSLNGKQTEYRIQGERGLVLVVTGDGVGSYYYRYQIGKGLARKFRSEKIGRRDEISLQAARGKAGELRLAVGAGSDPVAEKEARTKARTLRQLFAYRREKDQGRAASTLAGYQATLEADVFGELGDLPAAEITADQIARILENVEARSKHSAHKARSAIGSTYRWALKRRLVKINPTVGLGFTHASKPRNRVLTEDELRSLWQGIETEPGLSEAMRLLLKLAILTGQRMGEVAGASKSELSLNTSNPKWRIPAERMKRKSREQIVPLSEQGVALFKRAIELSGDSEFVFPADQGRVRVGKEARTPHINRESGSKAMARLREKIGLDDARMHDMRKCITTWLRERGTSSDVCDMILHHTRPGVTAAFYDFATLEGPVREALQRWADHVGQVASDKSASNVHQLERA